MAMSLPQIFRISARDKVSKFTPSNTILLSAEIRLCSGGNKPIVARDVTDLPLPDSPTKATVVCAGISNDIPFTISVYCLFSPLKLTLRFSTFNKIEFCFDSVMFIHLLF